MANSNLKELFFSVPEASTSMMNANRNFVPEVHSGMPAAALVTDAAAPKQSIRAPQKAAMLEAAA